MSISVEFKAAGIRDIDEAFRSVVASVAKLERDATRISDVESKKRVQEIRRAARLRSDAERALTRELSQEERSKLAAVVRSEREKIRASELSSQERRRAIRLLRDETLRSEREITEAVRGEVRRREQVWRDYHRQVQNDQKQAEARVAQRSRQLSSLVGGGVGAAGGLVSQGVGYASMAFGLMGGFQVAQAARSANAFERSAYGMSNATYIPEMAIEGKTIAATPRANPQDVMSFAKEASVASGVDKQELVTAWRTYIERSSDSRAFTSSDPKERKEARDLLITLARVAKGSDSNLNDVMNAAGFLRVQNESMTSGDMQQTMLNVIGQGKLGAISLSDLASNISTITAQSGQFSMGATSAQRSLMGLAQIAVQTSGTAPEAATTVSRFVAETAEVGKARKLAALGVHTRDKTGGLKDPAEILRDLFKATGGKTEKMDAIYDVRSMRLMNALRNTYTEGVNNELSARAAAKQQGIKRKDIEESVAGSQAVYRKVARFERAGYTKGEAETDWSNVMATREEKWAQVLQRTQDTLQDALVPALDAVTKKLPELSGEVQNMINWAAKNPLSAVGLAAGAAVTKSVADAAIGMSVKAIMEKEIAKSFMGGIQIGTATVIATTAYMAYRIGKEAIDREAKGDADTFSRRAMLPAKVEELRQRLKTTTDPVERAKLLEEAGTMEKELSGEIAGVKKGSRMENLVHDLGKGTLSGLGVAAGSVLGPWGMIGGLFGGRAIGEQGEEQRGDENKKLLEGLTSALKDLKLSVDSARDTPIDLSGAGALRTKPITHPGRQGPEKR